MRDIKFRAWNFKRQSMHSAEEMATDQLTLLPTGKFINVSSTSTSLSRIFELNEMLPMQYTGLKDKNGVEIYEGDVVRLDRINHKVIYDPAIFRLADKEGLFTTSGYPDWDLCEVIGNIYEHPNLLDKDA